MDIYEKHALLYEPSLDKYDPFMVDGMEYLTALSTSGVLRTEAQVERAYEKGKKFVWNVDQIKELKYTLLEAPEALFKGNKKVEKIIEKFYKSAYDNRTPYADTEDMKSYENFRNIKRDK